MNVKSLLLLTLLLPPAFATDGPLPLTAWRLSQGDSPNYAQPEFDIGPLEPIELPAMISFDPTNQVRWLVVDVPQEVLSRQEEIFLLLGRFDAAVQFFFNGVLLAQFGHFPPNYNFGNGASNTQILPPQLIRPINRIGLRFFRDNGEFPMHPPRLGGYPDAMFERYFVTFLNQDIYLIFAYLNLFIAVYSLMIWFFNRAQKSTLWYAATNLSFFIYFLRVGDPLVWLPFLPTLGFTRAFLNVAFFTLFMFYTQLFDLWKSKILRSVLFTVTSGFGLALILIHPDFATVNSVFSLSLLPGQVMILMLIAMSLISWFRGNKDATIILVGSAWGVGFGSHDIYHMVNNSLPLAWVQGIGIFGFNLSVFFYLALVTGRVNRALADSRAGLQHREQRLMHTLREVGAVGERLNQTVHSLQSAMQGTQSVIQVIGESTATVVQVIQEQSHHVAKTQENVDELLSSIQRIHNEIEEQSRQISQSVQSMSDMFASIQVISSNVDQTFDFIKNLDENIRRSVRAMRESQERMEVIRKGSEKISEIVETVNELAERTNLLSMNASIEAAHAGNAGKGFAVVAQEIKKLADSSLARSKEINMQVKEILQSIQAGVRFTAEVETLLSTVQQQSTSSVEQLRRVHDSTAVQRGVADSLSRILKQLEAVAQDVRNATDAQRQSSTSIREKIERLVQSFQGIEERTRALNQENGRLISSVLSLSTATTALTEAIENLQSLVKE